MNRLQASSRETTMEQYAGIDVSLEQSSVCIVDAKGKIVREAKVASEPGPLVRWFSSQGVALARIGLEAGPLSQWPGRHHRSAMSGGRRPASLRRIN
jgi:hypothetical protein